MPGVTPKSIQLDLNQQKSIYQIDVFTIYTMNQRPSTTHITSFSFNVGEQADPTAWTSGYAPFIHPLETSSRRSVFTFS